MITDEQAMNTIQEIMDGEVWSPDTLNRIAEIVRLTGRPVMDV
jgi:hypothetical protein